MRNTGRVLFALLFLVGVFGMATTGVELYVRLVYLSVLLLAGAWVWARLSLRGVSVSRRARSLRANMGDIFEENFEVQNNGSMPRLYLEVINHSTLPRAAGSRLLTWVGGHQSRSYLARTWLTRRGAYSLGPTVIGSGDPFGLFTVKATFPAADSLLVLPLIVPISDFPSPRGLLPGGKAIREKSMEITPHARGVREYVSGDPLKRIHWPSTARRGKLMVKEFEQDPQAEVWIFLDAQARVQAERPVPTEKAWEDWMFARRPELSLAPSTLEYGVCLAASLAHYFIQQRRAVGLVSGGPVYTVIPSERSERQEIKVLETLTFVTGQGKLPLSSLVDLQSPQMAIGSSAVLITPSPQDDVLLAVHLLQRRNLRPVVILLMADSFGGAPGSERIAEKLSARNIPTCCVYNGADLGEILAAFAAQYSIQEVRSWQNLPFIPST